MRSAQQTPANIDDRDVGMHVPKAVVVNDLLVVFSRHAVVRYSERVRAMSSCAAAVNDLARIAAAAGRIVVEPPLWVAWQLRTPAYLILGDDVVFPLIGAPDKPRLATTCLVRGSVQLSVAMRRRKRRRRR